MTTPTTVQDLLGRASLSIDGDSTRIQAGKACSAQNVAAVLICNWDGCGDGVISKADIPLFVSRLTPEGASEYTNAPIGSLFLVLLADSTKTPVIYDAFLAIKRASGIERMVTAAAGVQAPKIVTVTALTDADATLTIAQMMGGFFTQTPGANRTLTLDTAAHIVAGIPNCVVGSSIRFIVKNLAAATYSSVIAVGGTTNGGVAGDLTIVYSATAEYKLLVTNVSSPAVTLYKI